MPDITATDAARHFSDLLDAVEHRGEHFTIVRRGKAVASLEPTPTGRGTNIKSLLRRNKPDANWSGELADLRELLEIEARP